MNANDYLAEVTARAEAATSGPWEACTKTYGSEVGDYQSAHIPGVAPEEIGGYDVEPYGPLTPEDADFIAAAREDVPRMAAALRAVLDKVSDMEANGNSRELGDPTADTWHEAADLIRRAITEKLGVD